MAEICYGRPTWGYFMTHIIMYIPILPLSRTVRWLNEPNGIGIHNWLKQHLLGSSCPNPWLILEEIASNHQFIIITIYFENIHIFHVCPKSSPSTHPWILRPSNFKTFLINSQSSCPCHLHISASWYPNLFILMLKRCPNHHNLPCLTTSATLWIPKKLYNHTLSLLSCNDASNIVWMSVIRFLKNCAKIIYLWYPILDRIQQETFGTSVFKNSRISFNWNEAQSVCEHLVKNNRSIVFYQDFVDCHGRNLEN